MMEKSMMWEYINESPSRLHDLMASNQIDEYLSTLDVMALQKILFVASGSSYNIATVTRNLFESYANIAVETYTPFEFMDKNNFFGEMGTLVVAISQTGTSTGTIDAIKHAKSYHLPVLTMTERKDTPVQVLGDGSLNFLCGLENCNAKTKGYNNSLVLLQLLAMKMARKRQQISNEVYEAFIAEVEQSIQAIPSTIAATLQWLENHKDWATIQHFLMIGSGVNYGTAVEGMLKVLETLCVPASICDIGEFSHGFHRTIAASSNVMMIQSDEFGHLQTKATVPYLRGKVNRLLVVDASKNKDENADISVEHHPMTSSALNLAVVFQVIAAYLPEVIGFDPNRASNDDYTKLVNTRI